MILDSLRGNKKRRLKQNKKKRNRRFQRKDTDEGDRGFVFIGPDDAEEFNTGKKFSSLNYWEYFITNSVGESSFKWSISFGAVGLSCIIHLSLRRGRAFIQSGMSYFNLAPTNS